MLRKRRYALLRSAGLVLRFYRDTMLAGCLTVSLAFVWLIRLWGDPVLVGVLFLAKIASYALILFFVLDLQRTKFYYYENLGLRRNALLAWCCTVDLVVYWGLLKCLSWIPV